MVKLTAELIEQAAQYTNAVRDRELDLRGELGGARAASLLGARPRGAAPPRAPRPEPGPWASPPGSGSPRIDSVRALWSHLLPAPASRHGSSIPSLVRTR